MSTLVTVEMTNKYIDLKRCVTEAAEHGMPAKPCLSVLSKPCSGCTRYSAT